MVIGKLCGNRPQDTSDKLSFAITQQPADGTVTDNGDGTYSFDPGTDFQDLAEGKTRDVIFTYTATDPGGATSNAATGTITVTGVNDAPTAEDINEPASEQEELVVGSFKGSDVDTGDTLEFKLVSLPDQGIVINNDDGTFDVQSERRIRCVGRRRRQRPSASTTLPSTRPARPAPRHPSPSLSPAATTRQRPRRSPSRQPKTANRSRASCWVTISIATTIPRASIMRSPACCRLEPALSPTMVTALSPMIPAVVSRNWPKAKPPRYFLPTRRSTVTARPPTSPSAPSR